MRNLLKKPLFEKGNADWLSELPSITKQYNNTIHHSLKMTPNQTSKKSKDKQVFSNLQDKRNKLNPKFKLGHLVRTADIKRVFSRGDSTNCSYKLYTIFEVKRDIIPSYRTNYLPGRYNANFLFTSKLTLEQNNKFLKELKIIQ